MAVASGTVSSACCSSAKRMPSGEARNAPATMTIENTTKSAAPPPSAISASISSFVAFAAASPSFFAAATAALAARELLFLSIFRCASCVAAFRARFVSIFDTDVFDCAFGVLICSVSFVRIETPRRDFSLGAAFGFGFSRMAGSCSVDGACVGADCWTGGADLLLPTVTGWRFGVVAGVSKTGGCDRIRAAGSDG